jgi:hypothetical protein
MFVADELGWLDPCRGAAVDEVDVFGNDVGSSEVDGDISSFGLNSEKVARTDMNRFASPLDDFL